MVVIWKDPIGAEGSYDVPLQPAGPFWTLECVSKHNRRKDYEESFEKYEKELKVPYYLVFYPDNQELTLYHHTGRKYRAIPPNDNGRCPIPELDMEIGLLNGWVRFWFQGKLLPLPGDLQRELDETRRDLDETKHQLQKEKQRAGQLEQRLETAQRELELLRARLQKGKNHS
jgi:hypothetical protein